MEQPFEIEYNGRVLELTGLRQLLERLEAENLLQLETDLQSVINKYAVSTLGAILPSADVYPIT